MYYDTIASRGSIRCDREFADVKSQLSVLSAVPDLSTTVAADAGSAFEISLEFRVADKKVAATWRATHHAPEFLGEMLPMDGVIHGGGCSLGGRRWVDTGWLRRRRHHGMNECPVYPSAPLSATTVSRDSS